jgi:hypothetical protein
MNKKEEKRKILIIGVGGIGSYLTPLLHKTGLYDLHIADPDIVEEKNLYYQNFNTSHLGKKKVNCIVEHDVLGLRHIYPILTDSQLEGGYDLIICCADNLDARRLVYRQGFGDNAKTMWLDLRAQGRNGALISCLADPKFSDTFLAGEEGSFSCQGASFNDTTQKQNLHFTHVAIAGIGAQWIQRFFNEEQVKDKMVINI